VAACAAAGVAAIGAGDAAYGSVPQDLVEACRRHGVPLFEVPVEVSFRDIIDEVDPTLWAHRATGLAAVVGRHRGLVTAMAGGARLADLLPPVAADLGVRCWVLTAAGQLVAGTGPLPARVAGELAAAFLAAGRLPAVVTVDAAGAAAPRRLTLLGVPGRPAHRLVSWLLACAPAGETPDSALPDAATELVDLVALERARVDEAVRVERRLADRVGTALTAGAGVADLPGRLSACGLAPDGILMTVAASLTGPGLPAELPLAVCAELVRPVAPAVVTDAGAPGEALAVVAPAPRPAAEFVATVRAGVAALAPGLGGARLVVGLGGPAAGAGALPGAVEQARHALRTARARDGRAVVVSAADLTSHLLLLSGVPAEARRTFRDRLLGPLVAYDRTHGTELVRTLEAFLGCDGSWRRCAELLHVHVNTLRYRIGRVEQLTGRDLARFEDRVDFFLALRLPPPR
jgi:hypothetical protein